MASKRFDSGRAINLTVMELKRCPAPGFLAQYFSRLETPSNIEASVILPRKNVYLAGLIARESSIGEALQQSGTIRQ